MRDKNRIPKMLDELRKIWKEQPDLRLGQLIMIATRPKHPCPEVFSIEDEDILQGIQAIGNKAEVSAYEQKWVPYWEIYPQIIRIELEDLNTALVRQFIEAIRKEKPRLIITPISMMKLIGAPVDDQRWMSGQKERIAKLRSILAELERGGEIKAVEIGYRIAKSK